MKDKYISTKAIVDIGKEEAGVERMSGEAKDAMRVRAEQHIAKDWAKAAEFAKLAKRTTITLADINALDIVVAEEVEDTTEAVEE